MASLVDGTLGHVSAHGLAICLKSHNAYTSGTSRPGVSFFPLDFPLCLAQPLLTQPSRSLLCPSRTLPFSFSRVSPIPLLPARRWGPARLQLRRAGINREDNLARKFRLRKERRAAGYRAAAHGEEFSASLVQLAS